MEFHNTSKLVLEARLKQQRKHGDSVASSLAIANGNFAAVEVEVFEFRPAWRNPGEVLKNRIAKATYVKRGQLWRVYWQRADLRWHRYDAEPEVFSIEEFVERDEHSCFFG